MNEYHADFYLARGEGFSEKEILTTEKEKKKFPSDEAAKKYIMVDVRKLLKEWNQIHLVVYKNNEKIYTHGYTAMIMKEHMRHTRIQMSKLGCESMEFDGPWNEGFEERQKPL